MFALSRALKFQQPIFAFSQFQLLKGKYAVPPKPRKQRNADSTIHQQQLKEWQENYDVPKRPSITSEKIQFYGNKFPHLKTKWAELLQHIKTLPADEVAKNEEIIKSSAEQKTQIFQKRMEEYQNKYLVRLSNVTASSVFFSTIPFKDLKSAWAKYNELSEEEKQKYQKLANEENQKKNAKLEKIAKQFGMSLEEFKKEVRQIINETRTKKEESSSSSSDDEKKQSNKKEQKN
ncbi:unnamed protein product (macronuclear) [Paramecium tetraurelia]|uniref:HMG box domain-containing protein n=1 Tax=Paramecium tetraurelia TaxID=5888 RepID=A0CFH3_PARTE|nr:uncharacterized protein GSPATT00037979001 [Paramecium tetraurelia]CAK69540.1 unnamed protein product [Paramecium tetraurelia]|eukprot:XP_001436937.1 hypothetical protein (macronuclear) [Paramecium tetraurelia strain d4-2]